MITTSKSTSRKRQSKTQAQESALPGAIKAKTIKLGVDAHLGLFVVTRIIDGSTPQPRSGSRAPNSCSGAPSN
jgi:hypothetical protein